VNCQKISHVICLNLFILGSDISLIIWLWAYIVFVSFDCLIKAILCVAGLTGFGFHFCAEKCNCSSLFTVLYIGLCRVGLSKSFYVWFIRPVFVGECLTRIAVILVKTAKLIQVRDQHTWREVGGCVWMGMNPIG
jgi:hypothetical protein